MYRRLAEFNELFITKHTWNGYCASALREEMLLLEERVKRATQRELRFCYFLPDADTIRYNREFNRDFLTDSYTRGVLVNRSRLRAADIPDSLIAVKRDHLKFHRQVRDYGTERQSTE